MPRISVLTKQVSELIAAGEVVDRPASIVKELMENSVDAGATKITAEIKNGGISYIRITDDGCGIEREDVPKAFIRHATSKVFSEDDLAEISSFGFRGEALASVSAVSRVEIITRTNGEISGTKYVVQGSEEESIADAGCPIGTTIVVRDLFYNTPARMKFLKRDVTEGGAIATVVDKIALANPQVAIRFIRDGKVQLNTSGNGDLHAVIYEVHGKEFANGLIPVDYMHEFVHVTGFISKPKDAKATRGQQSFFVNSRYVRSKTCMAALEESFKSSLMTGRFPTCVLNITVPYETVDVNVHPTKIEVRFSNEKAIFDGVYHGCKTALTEENANLMPEVLQENRTPKINQFLLHDRDYSGRQQQFSAEAYGKIFAPVKEQTALPRHFNGSKAIELNSPNNALNYAWNSDAKQIKLPLTTIRFGQDLPQEKSIIQPHMEVSQKEHITVEIPAQLTDERVNTGYFKTIGELFGTYILAEYGDTFLLIDKHAAHERILYNSLKASLKTEDRQMLLSPVAVSLSRAEYTAAVAGAAAFLDLGFAVEDFGDGTVLVREIPTMLTTSDIVPTVQEIAEQIMSGTGVLLPAAVEKLLNSIACRSAVKAHDKNSDLAALVAIVEKDPNVRYCPHGRPVFTKITQAEIEKMFGRLV